MNGYLTPGELATLRSRRSAMLRQEWALDLLDQGHAYGFALLDADSPLGYDGRDDDSTDMRDRGASA